MRTKFLPQKLLHTVIVIALVFLVGMPTVFASPPPWMNTKANLVKTIASIDATGLAAANTERVNAVTEAVESIANANQGGRGMEAAAIWTNPVKLNENNTGTAIIVLQPNLTDYTDYTLLPAIAANRPREHVRMVTSSVYIGNSVNSTNNPATLSSTNARSAAAWTVLRA